MLLCNICTLPLIPIGIRVGNWRKRQARRQGLTRSRSPRPTWRRSTDSPAGVPNVPAVQVRAMANPRNTLEIRLKQAESVRNCVETWRFSSSTANYQRLTQADFGWLGRATDFRTVSGQPFQDMAPLLVWLNFRHRPDRPTCRAWSNRLARPGPSRLAEPSSPIAFASASARCRGIAGAPGIAGADSCMPHPATQDPSFCVTFCKSTKLYFMASPV